MVGLVRTCGPQRDMVYITNTQFMQQCIDANFNVQKVNYFRTDKSWGSISTKHVIVIPVGDSMNTHWSLIVCVRPWQFLEEATAFATRSSNINDTTASYTDKNESGDEARACCLFMDSQNGTHPSRTYITKLKRYRT